MIIGILKCDVSCLTCKGPTEYDCLSCGTNQTLINGDCVCDIASGYYNDSNNGYTCQDNCSAGYYMNPVTRSCT